MSRQYTLKKRAAQVADTRRRIVEATVDLHGSIGPAATTFSMIADRAAVQRHTLYAHFPDERSLFEACSGLTLERDPIPEATAWTTVADPRKRTRGGLSALYDWYARNEELTACVLRDAEHHALTRETADLRFGPPLAAIAKALGTDLTARQRALLTVAMSFHAWRTVTRDAKLPSAAAAELFAEAIAAISPASDTTKKLRRENRPSRVRPARNRV